MLKKNLLLTLLAVFSLLAITTSCEKTEPIHLVSDTNLKGQNTISVPAEGGTIHVTCTNYESGSLKIQLQLMDSHLKFPIQQLFPPFYQLLGLKQLSKRTWWLLWLSQIPPQRSAQQDLKLQQEIFLLGLHLSKKQKNNE